jgi:hypothetical protein
MEYGLILLLIAGGLLGASSLIVAKKPDAKELLAKLVPFQAGIGIALLVIGVLNLLRSVGHITDMFRFAPLAAIALFGSVVVAILLGFLFGMPLIAQWIPGDSPAEQKANEMSKKLAPFQTILGIAAIALALLMLLYQLGILKVIG